jgi:hypothetical protein
MPDSNQHSNSASAWQKTQYANLIRYVPSSVYFARIKVRGKLIRKRLKTDSLTVARLRLADWEKSERQKAESQDNIRGDLKSGISERLQTRVARASGPYRPATRRTERVRRSVCLRRPFPTVRPAPLSRAGSPAGRPVARATPAWSMLLPLERP